MTEGGFFDHLVAHFAGNWNAGDDDDVPYVEEDGLGHKDVSDTESDTASYSEDSSSSEFEDDDMFSYICLGPGLYLLKRRDSGLSTLAIVRKDHPFWAFLTWMKRAESRIIEEASGIESPSIENVDKIGIPGVVAKVISDTLYKRPVLLLPGGERVEPVDQLDVIGVPPGAEHIPTSEPHFTLGGMIDVEVDARYDYLARLASEGGSGLAPAFEMSHNEWNGARFSRRGLTGDPEEHDDQSSPISPVREGEKWYVVKIHYLAMYLSYRRMVEESAFLYGSIVGGKCDIPSDKYTDAQKNAVLASLAEVSTRESASNSANNAMWRAIDEVVVSLRLLKSIPAFEKTIGDLFPAKMDPSDVLAATIDAISRLEEATQRVHQATSDRFEG